MYIHIYIYVCMYYIYIYDKGPSDLILRQQLARTEPEAVIAAVPPRIRAANSIIK